MKHAVKVMDEIAAQIQEGGSLLGMIYSYMSENGAESERVYNAIRCLMVPCKKQKKLHQFLQKNYVSKKLWFRMVTFWKNPCPT
ncbi:hypothetical protein [Escherichia coli]|uniref:hypothetical protein n=1 Tax=Escherichia coli TaxID=562 RepID=UPI003CC914A1